MYQVKWGRIKKKIKHHSFWSKSFGWNSKQEFFYVYTQCSTCKFVSTVWTFNYKETQGLIFKSAEHPNTRWNQQKLWSFVLRIRHNTLYSTFVQRKTNSKFHLRVCYVTKLPWYVKEKKLLPSSHEETKIVLSSYDFHHLHIRTDKGKNSLSFFNKIKRIYSVDL